jgi:hypothetical protein
MKQFTVNELREIGKQVSMRYVERDNRFVSSNVTFDLNTGKAWSYKWYELARYDQGKSYINSYNYSNSTAKHKNKIAKLFDLLGLGGYTYAKWVEAPQGLNNPEDAIKYHKTKIIELQNLFTKPRVRLTTKLNAMADISIHQSQIEIIERMDVVSQIITEIDEVLK